MSDEETVSCGRCSQVSYCPAVKVNKDKCASFSISASERVADAAEGIEYAMMVGAGLWPAPAQDEAPTEEWDCSCGATLAASSATTDAECPNCHTCYLRAGGKWQEVDAGR